MVNMTMKVGLLRVFLLPALLFASTRACVPTPGEPVYDVLVVGMGVAGVGAATEVAKYNKDHPGNKKSIKMIEGWFRVGGRAIAAHWFHGPKDLNPMYQILEELVDVGQIAP